MLHIFFLQSAAPPLGVSVVPELSSRGQHFPFQSSSRLLPAAASCHIYTGRFHRNTIVFIKKNKRGNHQQRGSELVNPFNTAPPPGLYSTLYRNKIKLKTNFIAVNRCDPGDEKVCRQRSHLRAGMKEKCAAVLGEKLRGLSSGLVPERQRKGQKNTFLNISGLFKHLLLLYQKGLNLPEIIHLMMPKCYR